MTGETAVRALLDAITSRDPGAIEAALTVDARLRALVPPGLIEIDGAAAIAATLTGWFAGADPFEVLSTDVHPVADRVIASYRFRLRRAGEDQETVIEQNLMCSVSDGKVGSVDLVCSGFRPLVPVTARTDEARSVRS